MAMTGGYSAELIDEAIDQMTRSHQTRTRLHLLDLDHKFIQDLSDLRVDAGAVTVSGDQPITRSLSMTLVDRTDMLGLRAKNSTPKFLMQAWKGIYVDSFATWVDLPMICAYVTKPSRSGDLLTIEGQDKGALGLLRTAPLTVKEGTNAATAIRNLMGSRSGETRFKLASTSVRLSRDYVLDDQTTPLDLSREIAGDAGWVLFYDGEGYLVGRDAADGVVFTFRPGIGGTLTSPVQTGYWDGDIFNRVVGTGPVVSGKKIIATSSLPASHPLSEAKLSRGGVIESGRRTYSESVKSLKTVAKAEAWTERKLASLAIQQQTAAFSSVPVWHLQENDVIAVDDPLDGVNVTARWMQATIPLTSEGDQSNGYNRRPSVKYTARTSSRRVKKSKKK